MIMIYTKLAATRPEKTMNVFTTVARVAVNIDERFTFFIYLEIDRACQGVALVQKPAIYNQDNAFNTIG